MFRSQAILDAIARVYAVPGNDARWADVLEQTTGLVNGTAGIYLMIDNVESHTTQICSTFGYPRDEIVELYSWGRCAAKSKQSSGKPALDRKAIWSDWQQRRTRQSTGAVARDHG
ncbi:MAG: hypothetical protein WD928_13925 [Gammaproteobacteria bacterium]